MRWILPLLLLLALPARGDEWTTEQITMEGVYQVVAAMDWDQTRTIATAQACAPYTVSTSPYGPAVMGIGCSPVYQEFNPLLGPHPAVADVDRYFAVSAITHLVVSAFLPADWRNGWERLSVGFEAGIVSHNYGVGIQVRF